MAQTRTITRKKLAGIGALDFVSRALHTVWRPPPPRRGPPQKFLVVEPWGIGDVVLSTSLLQGLRNAFPQAKITMLAKAHAKDLLANTDLVDDIMVCDFPWTAFSGKLTPGKYVPKQFQSLVRRMRERDFDVSLDARRDIRSNVITYFSGARRRIGYDFGGGVHLLTDVLPSGTQDDHKVSDWLALLKPLGITTTEQCQPTLTVTEGEKANARRRIRMAGLSTEKIIVGVHPGASQAVRRWSPHRYAAVIDELVSNSGLQVVVLEEKEGDSAAIVTRDHVPRLQSSLRGFMAIVSECDLLLCSDSGPMHIANALGVPVTALFGPQRREWYGPRGELDQVVQVDDMNCRPCFDACIFATPRCMEGIAVKEVLATLRSQVDRVVPHQLLRQL
ncbi:MAG: glycosyltransferase family 9 protein [Gemmatimonadaceae bacterium]